MSRKPVYNYLLPDGSTISFREAKAAYAPNEAEFGKLRAKIVKIIGKETTPEFDDTLAYLITFMREKALLHANTTSITTIQKELSNLTKHLKKLQTILDSGLSDRTEMHLTPRRIKKMSEEGIEDPLYALYTNADVVMEICNETKEAIKGKKPDFTPHHMRQILAEELARELDKMGSEPKKYRDGDFANILKAVLKMISCKVHGKRIAISIPNDLFKLICDAIDAYPTKEPFSLLALD